MRAVEYEMTELVFEGLNVARAAQLSEQVSGKSLMLPTLDQGVVETTVPRLEIGSGVVLVNVHLRVLRYGGDVYDVELNFIPGIAECDFPAVLMASLHKFAIRLGEANEVDNYYAGIEPASDEETRFFTGMGRGPYF